MRQSIAEWEEAFHEQARRELARRERLRKAAARRSRVRRAEKVEKHGRLRYIGLVLAILATSVLVTFVMFETLARLIGN